MQFALRAARVLPLRAFSQQSFVRCASARIDATLQYENPLTGRYASPEMSKIWSPQTKFSTWRKLWAALAQAEMELGLPIAQEQVDEIKANLNNINFDVAAAKEKEIRHDVMAHVYALGLQAPKARPIIHLGATSCYVGDNTDVIQIRDSLRLIRRGMLQAMRAMRDTALQHRSQPTLGFTHLQPAQLTTVGKRMCLWLQDLAFDFVEINRWANEIPLLGVKGTTGTQASFLELFEGSHDKVKKLDARVCELMGFHTSIPVSGQTYTRKIDSMVLNALSGIAASANKMATDLRILASMKEVEEPFESKQVGSSAMPYKRNPMRSERICALARFVESLASNGHQTHAHQWMERSLDDSANRRLSLPQAFLATDIILSLVGNVCNGLQVWPNVINKHIQAELPFMATENILMACVKAGGDRQALHESIREHSMIAGRRVKEEGAENDLMDRIRNDKAFAAVHSSLDVMLEPSKFVGRAPEQVVEFITEQVDPLLLKYKDEIAIPNATTVSV